uniref:Translation initiation factor eIF2B subunit alpha n=1 Tax=Peromyscus maniculatus bairdii TaxID=230844 RepID=A0A8C8W7Q1_PERMB
MKGDPNMASGVAAIRTLLEFLKRDKGETLQGLRANLTHAIEILCGVDSSVAVSSGGELFLRFISLTSLEYSDYSKCKKIMIERGEIFLRRISLSRNKIADLCHTFIKDGARILTHAYSRVVLRVLEEAVAAKKRFSVYITESQPDLSGKKMAKALCHLNVPVTVVLDAAELLTRSEPTRWLCVPKPKTSPSTWLQKVSNLTVQFHTHVHPVLYRKYY